MRKVSAQSLDRMAVEAYKAAVGADETPSVSAVSNTHAKLRRRRRPQSLVEKAARAEQKRLWGDPLKADIQRRKEAGIW